MGRNTVVIKCLLWFSGGSMLPESDAEIVGLELNDIDMSEKVIQIRPKSIRRLKTANSARTLPLVG